MTSWSTPLSSVAENSMRCPCFGVLSMMRFTPGRNPRSAMWSASSSTVISMPSSVSRRWLRRSSRRPGHAMTMSAPLSSAATWRDCATPPKIIVITSCPSALATGSIVALIWLASSRVGHSTRRTGPARVARRLRPRQAGDGGQRERERLAGAGAAAAEDVTALQRVGQRGGLDRGTGSRCPGARARARQGWAGRSRQRKSQVMGLSGLRVGVRRTQSGGISTTPGARDRAALERPVSHARRRAAG